MGPFSRDYGISKEKLFIELEVLKIAAQALFYMQ